MVPSLIAASRKTFAISRPGVRRQLDIESSRTKFSRSKEIPARMLFIGPGTWSRVRNVFLSDANSEYRW